MHHPRHRPNFGGTVTGEGVSLHSNLHADGVVAVFHRGRQGHVIGGGIDDHGVATFNGGLRLGFRCLSGHLVERQLELTIGGSAAGVVGAPVAVLGVPLHVVAADGVFDIIQAVAQVDKLPIVIDSAKIHAGVGLP